MSRASKCCRDYWIEVRLYRGCQALRWSLEVDVVCVFVRVLVLAVCVRVPSLLKLDSLGVICLSHAKRVQRKE